MANLDFLNKEQLTTGIGNVINAKSYDEALVQAGLDWEVEAQDVYTKCGDTEIAFPKHKIIVRTADNMPLGIVSDKYKIVNNADAFAFTEALFNSSEIEFIRGGSYRKGSATWLEARLTGEYSVLGDQLECYMIFLNTHDGTGSVKCLIVPNRVVCSNALNIPLRNQARHWRCVHSGDPLKKIDEARDVLLAGSGYMEALNGEIEMLQSIKISDTDVANMIDRLFPISDDMSDKQREKVQLRRSRVSQVYYLKDDLSDLGDTAYHFISAVSDYADHVIGRRTETSAINRYIHVAHGCTLVDEAYNMVLSL